MNLNVEDDGTATVNFNLPAASHRRSLLLETVMGTTPYRRFIQVPAPDNDFDVSFYPEGGALMLGTPGKVAFKAMKSNGQSIDIIGKVYDLSGAEIVEIKSDYLGMGSFLLLAEQGKSYYAVCENSKGQSKRFELPVAVDRGFALSVSQVRGNLHVSVNRPAGNISNDELYLLAHTRGEIHLIELWEDDEERMVLSNDLFPSGVLHLILFDARLHPVSERLVFVNSQDQAKTTYSANREDYARRSLVKNSVTITGSYGQPLVGNFSVSVTSDREVTQDSTSNILTQLLLASDLRGHIENPAYYFQNSSAAAWALDLLMCTQGWRRYNVAEWAQGRFSWPAFPIETETHISGTVKNLVWGRPVENVEVTVLTLLFTNGYFNSGYTDKEGRFTLPIGEFPDSTRFSVSVDPKKGMTNMELTVDREIFPNRTLTVVPPMEVDINRFAQYAYKAEQQYASEGGVRVTELSAAVVTAERIVRPPVKSQYYMEPSNSLTEEQLVKLNVPKNDIVALLQQFPGVHIQRISQDEGRMQWQLGEFAIFIQGSKYPPLLLVDDIPTEIEYLDHMSVADIAQIDILKDAGNTSVFGVRAFGGVISIYTKRGDNTSQATNPSDHIKIVSPLGYQLPVEFYAPQYETEAQRNSAKPDLRTTIHWQPVVQTDSRGVATFEFYTADEPTSYSVVIEGLGADGQIIRKEIQLWKK